MTSTEIFFKINAPAVAVSLALTAYGCNPMQGTVSKIRALSKIIGVYMLLNQGILGYMFRTDSPEKNQELYKKYQSSSTIKKVLGALGLSVVTLPGFILSKLGLIEE